MRFTLLKLTLFLLVLSLPTLFQLGIVSLAFDRLNLTERSALLFAVTSMLGSYLNLPLLQLRSSSAVPRMVPNAQSVTGNDYSGTTLLAVNVGGCLVPIGLCLYLIGHVPLQALRVAEVTAVVAMLGYYSSRRIPGAGIMVSFTILALASAIFALLLNPTQAVPTAYIGGTLGVLFGTVLLRVGAIRDLRAPGASIGGAGTFDVVFLTGILAALIA